MQMKLLLTLVMFTFGLSAFGATESDSEMDRPTSAIEADEDEERTGEGWDYNAPGVFSQFGLHLGPNATNATYTADRAVNDVSGRTRMMVGLNTTMGLGSALGGAFYLQPEINYVQRGFNQPITLGNRAANHEVDANYLEIPLMLKIKPVLGLDNIRPYLVVGPSAAFKLSSASRLTSTDSLGRTTVLADSGNWSFNSLLLNMNAGLGTEFALSDAIALTVGLRYTAALTNMLSNDEFAQANDNLTQNAVQALAGVQVAL